jgi:hypothetical protein
MWGTFPTRPADRVPVQARPNIGEVQRTIIVVVVAVRIAFRRWNGPRFGAQERHGGQESCRKESSHYHTAILNRIAMTMGIAWPMIGRETYIEVRFAGRGRPRSVADHQRGGPTMEVQLRRIANFIDAALFLFRQHRLGRAGPISSRRTDSSDPRG